MVDLTLNTVRKSYGPVEVIQGIDMAIQSGEFCVFVGPSGCGKSTLLRMIAGLEEVTGGEVQIDGDIVNHIPAAQRGLAMVFQSYALYPHMSVRQNLSFGLENLNMPAEEIKQRVGDAARMLQIEEYLDRRPAALSGGQRQRVAIGRAVVREPKIFLFDEPLSNLDAELRVAMRAEISELHGRLGNTMIYVTHDQVEAMTMADKIAVLRKGEVEQFGKPLDLFNFPANRFVAGFIGSPSMNFAGGKVHGSELALHCGARLPVPETGFAIQQGQEIELGIRASHMVIAEDGALEMRVRSVEQLGSESYVYGTLSDETPITLHQAGQVQVAAGSQIRMQPFAEQMHLFDRKTGASLRVQ